MMGSWVRVPQAAPPLSEDNPRASFGTAANPWVELGSTLSGFRRQAHRFSSADNIRLPISIQPSGVACELEGDCSSEGPFAVPRQEPNRSHDDTGDAQKVRQ